VLEKRMPDSLASARVVITDSEAVRQEIAAHYGVAVSKVRAIPLGVSPGFRPRGAEELRPLLQGFSLEADRYFLCVGTLEPRKNLVRTVRAYSTLPAEVRRRFPLVVVGAVGWHEGAIVAELEPLVRAGDARVLNYVDDQALRALYAGARCLLYPSLYEGFGLPIAEAMASGVPVLTSNVGCMKELAEGAALLVDPSDTDGIARGLRRLLDDDGERASLRAAGLERARALTWRRCAERTLEVYRLALSG
jgi:alpha-1,3-rhamnosyl/mannosyltransferase